MFIDLTGHAITQWDADNLSDSELASLQTATNMWIEAYNSGDANGMASAHAYAEEIRSSYRESNEIGSDSGYTYVASDDGSSTATLYNEDTTLYDVTASYSSNEDTGESTLDSVTLTVKNPDENTYVPEKVANTGDIIQDNTLSKQVNKTINENVITDDSSGGTGNSGGVVITGKTGDLVITSGIPDTITKAAIEDAKVLINQELHEYHQYAWPAPYSINDFSFGKKYEIDFNDSLQYASNMQLLQKVADLGISVYKHKADSQYPIVNAINAYEDYKLSGEPGLKDIDLVSKSVNKAKDKMNYVNNTPYQYLIYDSSARDEFINKLGNLQNDINKQNRTPYNNDADDIKYNQDLNNYINAIIQLNTNYNISKQNLDYFLNRIDEKY